MNELLPALVFCPYCGEQIEVLIDPSLSEQNYIEDCQVCCRPIVFDIAVEQGRLAVRVYSENETQ